MPQDEQTPAKKQSSAADRAARKARRARRAAAKAAKVTTKSTVEQKADAKTTKAIINKAQHDREQKERERKLQDEVVNGTNWQWRKFALGLMNGLPNYKAYADAFDMNDVDRDDRAYKVAAVLSSRLLKNVNFRTYWRELIEEQGFNHDMVDSEMVRLITDPLTPPAVRRSTIRDYNELTGRIIKKNTLVDGSGKSLFDAPEFELKVVQRNADGSTPAPSV